MGILKLLIYKNYYYFGIGLNLVSILAIFALKSFLPPVVPLFYGTATGVGQLVTTYGLLIAPLLSTLIIIINSGLSLVVTDKFSKKVFAISSLVISILTTITVFKVITLVGFF